MEKLPKGYTRFDTAEHLKTEEDVREFIEAALQENGGDTAYLSHILNIAARARGMQQLAKETGLSRQALYKALSPSGNPHYSTIAKVLQALGLRLSVVPVN